MLALAGAAWALLFAWPFVDGGWVPLLRWVQRRLAPSRVIWDRPGRAPYLTRSYFWSRPKTDDGFPAFDETGQPRPGIVWRQGPIALHLHEIHQSDTEQELHSHPWRWAVSLILSGGYVEERRDNRTGTVRVRRVRPGQLVFLRAGDYHRLDLIGRPCWSLFLAGPRTTTWWFWNRETGAKQEWREFIASKRV